MGEPASRPNRTPLAIGGAVTVIVAAVLLASRLLGGNPAAAPSPTGTATWQDLSWLQVQPGELNGPGTTSLYDARQTGTGALAWGEASIPDPARPAIGAVHGLIWTSVDGLTWTTTPLPSDGTSSFSATGVTAGPPGYLAFGRTMTEGPETAIVSTDGIVWRPAAVPGANAATWRPETAGDEFLVSGVVGERPVVWASRDGSQWTVEAIPAAGRLEVAMLSVTPAGTFLSGHLATDRDWDAAIWRRVGPGSWERLAEAEPEFVGPGRGADVTRILSVDGGLLAIGSAGVLDPCVLGAFGMGPPGVVARPLADVCPGIPGAAWVSRDGQHWDAVEGPRPAGWRGQMPYLDGLTSGADGVVGLINETPDEARPTFGLWTSANGRDWRRVGGDLVPVNAYPQATLAFPDRVVVLGGTDDGHVVAWIGEPVTDR